MGDPRRDCCRTLRFYHILLLCIRLCVLPDAHFVFLHRCECPFRGYLLPATCLSTRHCFRGLHSLRPLSCTSCCTFWHHSNTFGHRSYCPAPCCQHMLSVGGCHGPCYRISPIGLSASASLRQRQRTVLSGHTGRSRFQLDPATDSAFCGACAVMAGGWCRLWDFVMVSDDSVTWYNGRFVGTGPFGGVIVQPRLGFSILGNQFLKPSQLGF